MGGKQYYKWKELFLANLTHCFLLIYIFNLKNAVFSEIFACSRNVMIPGYHRLSTQYQYQKNYMTLNTQFNTRVQKQTKNGTTTKTLLKTYFSSVTWFGQMIYLNFQHYILQTGHRLKCQDGCKQPINIIPRYSVSDNKLVDKFIQCQPLEIFQLIEHSLFLIT